MLKTIPLGVLAALAALVLGSPIEPFAGDTIVFTANQGFLSRIYVLDTDGSVIHHHQFSNYRFVGMEVVNGELYVAEAFAPRVYKVDPATGSLQVFIDDWSLYYFYDVAFDGTYFYVDEWNLRRYDINGNFAGSASFSEYVLGCTWDGEHFWTLDDTNLMKCWDLSGWPNVALVPERNFTPPSPNCRGLFFDGEYFWSAERGDSPGWIYQFDGNGTVVQQIPEPAHSGWGAALIRDDSAGIEAPGSGSAPSLSVDSSFPNPAGGTVTIRFTLPEPGVVELSVCDVNGRVIGTLQSGHTAAGVHLARWRPEGLSSGVYWAVLKAGGQTATGRIVILR